MKIYELRDITSDEVYFTKGFFSTKERAFEEALHDDAWKLIEDADDYVSFAVYEHELDKYCREPGNTARLIEVRFSKEWKENSDDEVWVKTAIYPKEKKDANL